MSGNRNFTFKNKIKTKHTRTRNLKKKFKQQMKFNSACQRLISNKKK